MIKVEKTQKIRRSVLKTLCLGAKQDYNECQQCKKELCYSKEQVDNW